MTNEDIIRMAQDVGAARLHSTGNIIFGVNALQHFVELIVAAEREACAELTDEFFNTGRNWAQLAAAIRARGQ